jgi:hypothetical protein
MPAKSVVMAIVLSGWLIAAVFAALIVAYTSFFGVGVIGIMIWFVCTQAELGEDSSVSSASSVTLLASLIKAQNELPREQRAAVRHRQSLAMKSTRFFKYLAMALTALGFSGFLYFQL